MTDIQYAVIERYRILLDGGVAKSTIDRHILTIYGSDALQWVKEWIGVSE